MTSRNDTPPEPNIHSLQIYFFATEPDKARVICNLFRGGGFDGSVEIRDLEAIPELNQIAHRLITFPVKPDDSSVVYDYVEIRFAARQSIKPGV